MSAWGWLQSGRNGQTRAHVCLLAYRGRPVLAVGAAAFALALALSACIRAEEPAVEPTVLRVALLPDRDAKGLDKRLGPLLEYLQWHTGLAMKPAPVRGRDAFLAAVRRGEVHLAFLSGFDFVVAHRADGMLPLVVPAVDSHRTSVLFVRTLLDASSPAELRGRRLVFGPRRSVPGHLMPRYFMERNLGIQPESFFSSVRYAKTPEGAVATVASSEAEAGVVEAGTVAQMVRQGRLPRGGMRVIWQSPPYAGKVWAVSPRLAPGIRRSLMKAFLSLTQAEPAHQAILEAAGTGVFLPADLDDFARLGEIMGERGVVGTEEWK